MKRNFITLLAVIISASVLNGQNIADILRYSNTQVDGTARSAAMGNAFTALGGDLGAININPASSGVYKFTEISYTPSLMLSNTDANYLGNSVSGNKTMFGTSNIGIISTFDTGRKNRGLINWNMGLTYSKDNNYTNIIKAHGSTASSSWLSSLAAKTDGIYAPNMDINDNNDPYYNFGSGDWSSILAWNTSLLDTLPGTNSLYKAATENLRGQNIGIGGELNQRYKMVTIGNTANTTLNFGGNFSNKFFFGFNINIKSIWYKMKETYSESATNSNNFDSGFESFSRYYSYKTSGTGVSIAAGAIYLPTTWLRIGASITTPTWMYLHEEYEENIGSSFNDGYRQLLSSPLGSYNYDITSPFRFSVGLAATIGKFGAISVDYENVNYSSVSMKGDNDEKTTYGTGLRASRILRGGLEIIPVQSFALRAGYQYQSDPYKDGGYDTHIASAGIGFSSKSGFFADVTYQQLIKKYKDTFQLYNDIGTQVAPIGSIQSAWSKVLLTVGVRF